MQENTITLFSKRVSAGKNRIYSMDVRQSEKAKYLLIGESRLFEGSWRNNRLLLFPDYVEAWKGALEEALTALESPSGKEQSQSED